MNATESFREARDFLIKNRTDYERVRREFRWPRLQHFNWATDWFDEIARGNHRDALQVVGPHGLEHRVSFEQMRVRSNRLAHRLLDLGLRPGDRILLMLGNVPELWELLLAAVKLQCPVIPTSTLMMPDDLRDRLERGEVRAVATESEFVSRFHSCPSDLLKLVAGGERPGWNSLDAGKGYEDEFVPLSTTPADSPLLLYFTSGTTSKPKLVVHTHVSYPVGHLSTMYWLGVQPGDVHLSLSSPGWAKHAWSSFFAPWNAEATILAYNFPRFDATALLTQLVESAVTTFCAPPTVWRALLQEPLKLHRVKLREALSAGEPLNAEVINCVREAWGISVRDGYGQTETTLQVGNFPGQTVRPGSMGKPAPGYDIDLVTPDGVTAEEGEIAVALQANPVGVMPGYVNDLERTEAAMRNGRYHTGDVALRDADGYLHYVGRNDDVFKSSGYRISPFELESALIEHEAVTEAAVVPSPDERRLWVPKAFVVLAAGFEPGPDTARTILGFLAQRVSPYKRVRRIEFASLPKTISGKIRRVDLRQSESNRGIGDRREFEYWEEDLT